MKEAAMNAAMRARKAFAALAICIVISMVLSTVLGALAITPAAASSFFSDGRHKGGFVVPCSLVGVNPVYHPDIFGNPAFAEA
jgi:multidrug efflux pump subunit AcrB